MSLQRQPARARTRYRLAMGLSEPALSLTDLALGLVVHRPGGAAPADAGRAPLLAPHVLVGRRRGARGGRPPRRRDLLGHVGRPELGGHQHDGRDRGLLPARGQRGRGPRARAAGASSGCFARSGLVAYVGAGDRRLRGGELDPRLRGHHDDRDPRALGPRAARPPPAGGARSIVAILASGAAAGVRALPSDVTELVGLDPTSLYHLAQIPGMVLLYHALVAAPQRQPRAAPAPAAVVAPRLSPDQAEGQPTLRTGRPCAFMLGGCPSPPPPPRAT